LPFARIGLALLAAALALLAGLQGPWVLDDHVNLVNLVHWLNGDAAWQAVVLDNASGPLGRPLAYLSFLVNAALTGYSPFAFRLVNLALHLLCGLLAYLLLRELLARLAPRPAAETAAALSVALWLLLPIQVSTVLYPVQRMTLLSALCSLLALLAYLRGRQQLATDPAGARRLLFLGFPFFCLLALLAKENGALTPLYALLVEACFLSRGSRDERRTVAVFFALFLLLPLLAGLLLLAINPLRWLSYAGREFGLAERLLTQPVVLLEYLRAILLPLPGWLHLYREGHPIAPLWAGLAAGLFWLAWTAAGLFLVRRRPLLAFGLLFFVAGHLIESTLLPLELYFEHRNYLPSLGVMLALAGLVLVRGRVLPAGPAVPAGGAGGAPATSPGSADRRPAEPRRGAGPAPPVPCPADTGGGGQSRLAGLARSPERLVFAALLVLAALHALGTAHRAWHWRDLDRLLATEGPAAPEISRRLQVDRAIRALETGRPDDLEAALGVLDRGNPGDRAAGAQWRLLSACDREGRAEPALLRRLAAAAPPVVTHNHASYMSLLVRRVERGGCAGLDAAALSGILAAWTAASTQPDRARGPQQLAIQHARLKLLQGDAAGALALLPDTGRPSFEAQTLRIRALIALGRKLEARDLIVRAQAEDRGWYRARSQLLAQLASEAR
jgi:hypothetical protein